MDTCLAKATSGTAALLASADQAAAAQGFACPGTMATLRLDGRAGWLTSTMLAQVFAGNPLPSTCVARHTEALFKYAARYAECNGKDYDASRVSTCSATLLTNLRTVWKKLFTPACIGADIGSIEAQVREAVDAQADLLRVVCGDSVRAGFEQCDDGNHVAGDGCEPDCTRTLACGDGLVQPANHEECDDGNRTSDDGCSSSCRRETCGVVSGAVRCLACPEGSHPAANYLSCTCDPGFVLSGGECRDIDECALGTYQCAASTPCVNVPGSYSCSIPCTEAAFHEALAACGGPGRVITFDCRDTTIAIHDTGNGARASACNDLVIDGLDRNITFEMTPRCWGRKLAASACKVPLNADGTCDCPDVDSGTYFLSLRGDRMTVRNLTVKSFFEGIKTSGNDNTVRNVTFERNCDEDMGNNAGVGNLFENVVARNACGKCMQNYGKTSLTSPHPELRSHYNAIVRDSVFTDCQQPIRMTEGGRYLIDGVLMEGIADSGNFRCLGPRFDGGAAYDQIVHMTRSVVEGCDRGVRVGGAVQARLWNNVLSGNRFRGLLAVNAARVSMWDNLIIGNGGLGTSEPGVGGVAVDDNARVDLGGDALVLEGEALSSPGGNRFCGNVAPNGSKRDVHNLSSGAVMASQNLWCTTTPRTNVLGTVVTDPFATWAP